MNIAAVIAAAGLAHMIGDYVIQSHWMANRKTSSTAVAILHGITYTLPFLLLPLIGIPVSVAALLVIGGTHAIIDRWRLARYLVWFRNLLAPKGWRAPLSSPTGSPASAPDWLSYWLLFIADNVAHMLINVAAVVWL